MKDADVVDLAEERRRRKSGDLYVECPRCGERTFMHHTRCQACGLWFQGEAFQFAPSDIAEGSRHSSMLRNGARALLLLLGVAALLGLGAAIYWME